MLAQKNKSEKNHFYFTIRRIYMEALSVYYQHIEKNGSFHLIYYTIFYSFWFMNCTGKYETTSAPVLSILKEVEVNNEHYPFLSSSFDVK